MSDPTARATVRDVLQQGYGDATQTVLDDQVAGDVIASLRSRGWASLSDVAALILAAGGEIRVSDQHFMQTLDGVQVTVHEDYATRERVFRVESPKG